MLARQLAALLAARMGSAQGEGVHELRMPEDAASAAQVIHIYDI